MHGETVLAKDMQETRAASLVTRTTANTVWFCAIPSMMFLLFHAGRYYPFVADDTFISLRYAHRFAQGEGLTWNAGERVEGYSNLTWILANALLHTLGVDLILASRLLGVACTLAVLALVVVWERRCGTVGLLSGVAGATAMALLGPIAVWTVGGLEQPMVILFLIGGIVACGALLDGAPSALPWARACLALSCITRPDGPLLASLIVLMFYLASGISRRSLLASFQLAWPASLAVLGQLLFRLIYYDDWVPNTARVKVAFTMQRLEAGWTYVADGAGWTWPLLALAAVVTLLGRAFHRRLLLVWAPFIGWTGYVAFIGGDTFPGRRHLTVSGALLALTICSGIAGVLLRAYGTWLAGGLTFAACCMQLVLTYGDPENTRAITERWEFDEAEVGRMLGTGFRAEQPLVAVDAAGSVPYFSQLPSLDLLGLNDRYIAHHPPADHGSGFIGHDLGNGDYVWRRRPDILYFCVYPASPSTIWGGVPCFRSAREFASKPELQQEYMSVAFQARAAHPITRNMLVRKNGRIGWAADARGVRIPGYMIASTAGVAVLDRNGRIGTELPPHTETTMTVPVACPGCRVAVDGDPGVRVELISANTLGIVSDRLTHVRSIALHHP